VKVCFRWGIVSSSQQHSDTILAICPSRHAVEGQEAQVPVLVRGGLRGSLRTARHKASDGGVEGVVRVYICEWKGT